MAPPTIATTTGSAPRWYRAATGYYSPEAIAEIQRLGFGIADIRSTQSRRLVHRQHRRCSPRRATVASSSRASRSTGIQPAVFGVVAGIRELQQRGASFLRLDQLGATELADA